jgi:type IV secretion system protein VirD4
MRLRTLLIVDASLLAAGTWAATQWGAYRLDYHHALGWSIPIGAHRVYAPWQVFIWMHRYSNVIPETLNETYGILAGTLLVTILLTALVRRTQAYKVRPIGQDRWGTTKDMRAAGLFGGIGTVVGEFKGCPLTYNGPEHQLVSGASRSGKGVGHVVPTLLAWPASALVYDVKNELYPITAGWRSTFGRAICFNPTASDSARFNPLFEIRKGPQEIRDAQNVAEMLVNPEGAKRTLDIWDTKAAELLVALMLHVLYTAPENQKNLATVRIKLFNLEASCREMAETPHLLNKQTGEICPHPEIERVAKDLLSKYPKFRDSVCAAASSYLTLYADPMIAEMTSTSDFRLSDLMCHDRPLTLYLQPPPSDAPRLRPLVRLIINQVCRALMDKLKTDHLGREKRRRLLLLLDEFPTLGRLDFLSLGLRQMAGYGIKAHLIVQSFNDILEAYGNNNTIIDNCHILTAFASADTTTCQRISQMSGTTTEYRESYSEHRGRHGGLIGHRSVSYSEQVRPLLQPGDVRELPADDQLLFVTGFKPMRVKKLRYYASAYFKDRLLPGPVPKPVLAEERPLCEWTDERAKGPRVPAFEELSSNVPPRLRARPMPLFNDPPPKPPNPPASFDPSLELPPPDTHHTSQEPSIDHDQEYER